MKKILIVDDSLSIVALISQTLEDAGFACESANDGRRATELLRKQEFDLMITDIYMPDQDGIETIIMAKRLQSQMRIIAISSNHGLFDQLSVAGKLGADVCLRKPFNQKTLLETVDSVLGQKESGDA